MSDIEKAYQATPAATLEQQIMDPNFPKNEREWWAAARIEQLEAALRSIDELFADAAQDDCENGVRWLNERAAEKYLCEYPHTSAAISFAHEVARAELEEPHMTSDLYVKGPAVRSSEHNPEREIPGIQAAPHPGNDPSGVVAEVERLRAALFDIAGMHELSVYDYLPTTRLWMHQKVARDALGVTSVELEESL